MKATMRDWRCRWDGKGSQEGERVVSAVAYTEKGAHERARLLRTAGWKNVEVYESKIGSYDEV